MRKLRTLPLFTQFGLMIVLLLIISGAALWRISALLSETTFNMTDRAEIESAVNMAEDWVARTEAGTLREDELQAIVNPALNPAQIFVMIMDPRGRVIAFSDNGVAFFGGDKLGRFKDRLDNDQSFSLSQDDTGTWVLLIGKKPPSGYYIIAGRPTHLYRNTVASYRLRLRNWIIPGLLMLSGVLLILGIVSARPLGG